MLAKVFRRLLVAIPPMAILGIPALAGDLAQREILGFSEDAKRFAFEEYGVYDGSGFPYSTIYVIDTQSDQWVAGTPIRIKLESEHALEDAARAAAGKAAAPFLKGIKPRGSLLASNPPTEIAADPHLVHFRNNPAIPPYETGLSSEYELRLDDVPVGENKYVDMDLRGFRLILRQVASEAGVTVPGYELSSTKTRSCRSRASEPSAIGSPTSCSTARRSLFSSWRIPTVSRRQMGAFSR
jgi:predicted secreted protein